MSPNPGVPYTTFRHTVYTHRKNSAAYSFGHQELKERFGTDLPDRPAAAEPGPGAYAWDAAFGHASGGRGGSSPAFGPTAANARWGADASQRSNLGLPAQAAALHALPPGPGRYLTSPAATHLTGGSQALAGWRNAGSAGWGRYCDRAARAPAVVSKDHARHEGCGAHSPGPATAAPVDAVGRQLLSTRATQPRCTFSRSERFERAERMARGGGAPGPGAYEY